MEKKKINIKELDLPILIAPFVLILAICLFLFLRPNDANAFFISKIMCTL